MGRTDCYTATVSHCRGGVISTTSRPDWYTATAFIAGVVGSIHEQNRLLNCYCLLLQG